MKIFALIEPFEGNKDMIHFQRLIVSELVIVRISGHDFFLSLKQPNDSAF